MKQRPLPLGTSAAPTFERFAVGANAGPLAALQALRAGDAPVYLWGPAGAGKTHLLAALASAARARGERVGAFSPALPAPWAWDEGWRWLLLDGCEAFDAAQQHAAFTLFVEAAGAGATVAAAGRWPPVDLPLRDDLRSRLASGPVFQLQPLAEPEIAAVLKGEASRRGIALGDEVLGYLLTRFARDLGSLMALLDALDSFSLAEKRTVTVPLLKQMLVDRAQEVGA